MAYLILERHKLRKKIFKIKCDPDNWFFIFTIIDDGMKQVDYPKTVTRLIDDLKYQIQSQLGYELGKTE